MPKDNLPNSYLPPKGCAACSFSIPSPMAMPSFEADTYCTITDLAPPELIQDATPPISKEAQPIDRFTGMPIVNMEAHNKGMREFHKWLAEWRKWSVGRLVHPEGICSHFIHSRLDPKEDGNG